jgi:hypothetical protein
MLIVKTAIANATFSVGYSATMGEVAVNVSDAAIMTATMATMIDIRSPDGRG